MDLHSHHNDTETLADLDPANAAALVQPGDIVDHYEIVEPLGKGGMSTVYRAIDVRLQREVAIKLVQTEPTSTKRLRQLVTEAQITARFNHRNIVTIHGVGEFNGVPYLALELLDGDTLRSHLQRGDLSRSELLHIAVGVAAALQEAHRHGVHHLDLKPGNIFVVDGEARVLDFGLSQTSEPSSRTAAIAGTPAYMAPEQWGGDACGAAADIWALGVVFTEAFGGARIFRQRGLDALRQAICSSNAALLAALALQPPVLAELLAQCVQRQAAQRPEAAELYRAFTDIRNEPSLLPREGRSELPKSLLPAAESRASTNAHEVEAEGLVPVRAASTSIQPQRSQWRSRAAIAALSTVLLAGVMTLLAGSGTQPLPLDSIGQPVVVESLTIPKTVPTANVSVRAVATSKTKAAAPAVLSEEEWYAHARRTLNGTATAVGGRCFDGRDGPNRFQLIVRSAASGKLTSRAIGVPFSTIRCVIQAIDGLRLPAFKGEPRTIRLAVRGPDVGG